MTDGRHRRTERSGEAMLLAGLRYAEDGNWRPSAKDIAIRANVSLRTFFQHFKTLENYSECLLVKHEASLRAAMWVPNDPLRLIVLGKP